MENYFHYGASSLSFFTSFLITLILYIECTERTENKIPITDDVILYNIDFHFLGKQYITTSAWNGIVRPISHLLDSFAILVLSFSAFSSLMKSCFGLNKPIFSTF